MGATHQLDLTHDVTHLLVGDTDTPKYKFVAKERPDVKVLSPDFVDAVRLLWIQGDEIDMIALEETYRLPTFAGLRVCLTGFDDPIERQKLQNVITMNGATYYGDLTKNITHLIAARPEGNKFKYASMWGLRIVSIEWLKDSVVRGMILEESLYSPSLSREDRGRNSWIRKAVSESWLGKRKRIDEQSAANPGGDMLGRRKLRRTTSNKLRRQNSSLWGDIIGGGTPSREVEPGAWDESRIQQRQNESGEQERIHTREGQHGSNTANRSKGEIPRPYGNANTFAKVDVDTKRALFSGTRFYLHGFDPKKTAILRSHLLSHDADITISLSDISQSSMDAPKSKSYVVIPHDIPLSQCPEISSSANKPITVTEWWVERCLHHKKLVDPASSVICRPFHRFPIDELKGMIVCSTAFTGVDLMHISKVVKLMGAVYDEYLSPRASVLVCNDNLTNKEKLDHALEWSVPAVSVNWLWDMIESQRKLSFENYLISPNGRSRDNVRPYNPASQPDVDTPRLENPFADPETRPAVVENVLRDCVVCVSSKLKLRIASLRQIAMSLGAIIADELSTDPVDLSNVTHFVHPYEAPEGTSKEYEIFSSMRGCHVVSPEWLHKCADAEKRVDEQAFLCMTPPPKATSNFETHKTRSEGGHPMNEPSRASEVCTESTTSKSETVISNNPSFSNTSLPEPKPEPKPEPTTTNAFSKPIPNHGSPNLQPPIPTPAPTSLPTTNTSSNNSINLQTSIAALLAHHQGSSTLTNKDLNSNTDQRASIAIPLTGTTPARRKPLSRLLGRAPSNSSGRSFSRASSVDSNAAAGNAGGSNLQPEPGDPPEPSQKVLYDDPAGREQRERVLRKMHSRRKGNGQDVAESAATLGDAAEGGPVAKGAEIRVVKDRDDDAGIGSRTRAKGKTQGQR
ncbi:MAG: hypothetical protein M1837_002513 [Sclerophora amabilis]|nr:MAG: hypothetical protein M1837_002513 [Sclerophora amabilis]